MWSGEIPEEIVELNILSIPESENVLEIGALYKIFKFILIFESKTAKEELKSTKILSCFGDYDLTLTAIRSSQKWEGSYFCYTFPSWIHKWPGSRLAFSNFGEAVPVFKGRHKFNRNIRNGKGHVKIFPTERNSAMLPKKIIFHDSIRRGVLFAEKVVFCYRCNPRRILGENFPYSYTHPKNLWHVFDWAGWHSSSGELNLSANWTFCCDSL